MRRGPLLAAALALVAAANLLPAAVLGWLPACPLRTMTGLLCPLCGATHALFALARGDVGAAWRSHPLVIIGLASWALLAAGRAWSGPQPPLGPRARRGLAIAAGALIVAFGVGRNLVR